MWLKCGTKISNEINKLKKSAIFFGSVTYPKKSVFVSFLHEMSGFVRFGAKGGGRCQFSLVLRCDPCPCTYALCAEQ